MQRKTLRWILKQSIWNLLIYSPTATIVVVVVEVVVLVVIIIYVYYVSDNYIYVYDTYDSALYSTDCPFVMKTSLDIMNLLEKPEWH